AVALDPLSPIVQDQLISPLIAVNRFDDARAELAKLQREHPDFSESRFTEANLALAQGDLVALLRSMQELVRLDPAALQRSRFTCSFIVRFGALEQGIRCLDDLARRAPDMTEELHADRAGIIVDRDGPAAALEELQRAKAPSPGTNAYLLLCLGRNDEALATL